MHSTDEIPTYSTSDIYLAAYLKSRDMKINDKETHGRRTTFIFEDIEGRKDLVRDFYNGGPVDVTKFVHALQDLKTIVFTL